MHFIRGRVAEVTDWADAPEEEGKLVIRAEDTLIGVVRRIPVDMVDPLGRAGAAGRTPSDVRRMFNISCGGEGWFIERHPKLAPVSTFTDGVFLAGACQGPKDIPDTRRAGRRRRGRGAGPDRPGYVELEPNTAYIDEEFVLRLQDLRRAVPVQRDHLRRRSEEGRGERGAVQGLRHRASAPARRAPLSSTCSPTSRSSRRSRGCSRMSEQTARTPSSHGSSRSSATGARTRRPTWPASRG